MNEPGTEFSKAFAFPPLPYEAWKDTKNTLHLYLQIVGKVRLGLFPKMNHWWHVPFYVSTRGLTTRPIPYGYGNFEIEFDFNDHQVEMRTSGGRRLSVPLRDGLTVADFYEQVIGGLASLGIEAHIKAKPYDTISTTPFAEDAEHKSYDAEYVNRFWRVLVGIDAIFEEFRGRFSGKSTPVHVFWHSFDLALTRFSGREAPAREGAGRVEAEAYSPEVVSFGFWAGDEKVPAPAFYSYTFPEPEGLTNAPLRPEAARWAESGGGHLALLMYEDVRASESPRDMILEFLESAYDAGARLAGWDREALRLKAAGR